MGHLPRVVLLGGVNFIGMGKLNLIPSELLRRSHYSHSDLFTHVQCTTDEIVLCANILGTALAQATAPTRVLVPMGGFSSEDRPGGEIENEELRHAFADTLETHIPLSRISGYINDRSVAVATLTTFNEITKDMLHA